jgi:ATP-binding cassette subfamily F protein uup
VAAPAPAKPKTKLSYKEQRLLDELPGRITALEAEQATLSALLAGTELYTQGAGRIQEVTARHAVIDDELMALLESWEQLSARN